MAQSMQDDPGGVPEQRHQRPAQPIRLQDHQDNLSVVQALGKHEDETDGAMDRKLERSCNVLRSPRDGG